MGRRKKRPRNGNSKGTSVSGQRTSGARRPYGKNRRTSKVHRGMQASTMARSKARYNHWFQEADTEWQDQRLLRLDNYSVLQAQVANLSPLVEQASYPLIQSSGLDKWNADQIADWGDYVIGFAELIIEMRCQMQIISLCPGTTRNDASAGLPFTRSTINSVIQDLADHETGLPYVPALSLAIATVLTTRMQIAPPIEMTRRRAIYFTPTRMNKTASEIETLISSLITEAAGLVGSNQFQALCLPLQKEHLMMQPEISFFSDLGLFYAGHIPVSDDAATQFDACQTATNGYALPHFGPAECYGAMPLLATGTRTNFGLASASGAAGKLNLRTFKFDGTITTIDDTDMRGHFLRHCCALAGGINEVETFMFQNFKLTRTTPVLTEAGWDSHLVAWMTRHLRDATIPARGLPVFPDLVVDPAGRRRKSQSTSQARRATGAFSFGNQQGPVSNTVNAPNEEGPLGGIGA